MGFLFAVSFFLFLKSLYLFVVQIDMAFKLFAILQKYDFSSKSQQGSRFGRYRTCCLRYCKSTIFQANHNHKIKSVQNGAVVCDTAKVRFFKQITTYLQSNYNSIVLFAILQKYDFSSKSQLVWLRLDIGLGCLRYCKSTIFQANHNTEVYKVHDYSLFAILQKYDFSSKSQLCYEK